MTSVALALSAAGASAQVTPAAGLTPPDDTPSIRVGMTLFPAYVFQTEPKITDAGNSVSRNAFDILRSYINITGNISHIVAYRVTPDITRESGLRTLGTASTVASASGLLQRPLCGGCRAQPHHGQRHLRASVCERRIRFSRRKRPDAPDRCERERQGVLGMGDAAKTVRQWRVLGSVASLRSLD